MGIMLCKYAIGIGLSYIVYSNFCNRDVEGYLILGNYYTHCPLAQHVLRTPAEQ